MQRHYATGGIRSAIMRRTTCHLDEGPMEAWHIAVETNDHTSLWFTDVGQSLSEDTVALLAGKTYELTDPNELAFPDIFVEGKGLVRAEALRFQFGNWLPLSGALEAEIAFRNAAHDITICCQLRFEAPTTNSRPKNVLFLCRSNLHRSRTAEDHLKRMHPALNVRSAGVSAQLTEKAGTKLATLSDLEWADVVFVMEESHRRRVNAYTDNQFAGKIIMLEIADRYSYMDELLLLLLDEKLQRYLFPYI